MDDTGDTAVVVVKQSFNEKVIKRSFSSSALQAAEGIKLEFFQNIRSQMRLASSGTLNFYPKVIGLLHWVQTLTTQTSSFCFSGAGHDSFEIERSLMVGISCLPFLILSMQFFRAHFYLHGVQFLLQAWLSFQADCWSSKSKFYNIADRFSASGVILFGPVRTLLRNNARVALTKYMLLGKGGDTN